MAAVVGKLAAKKLLKGHMKKYQNKDVAGDYDPLFAQVPHPSKPGKFKKVKKQIPNYIPEKDAIILANARKRAYMLDMSLCNFFGIRFGWSSVLGLIPAAGDFLDLMMALYHFFAMRKVDCGLDGMTLLLMLINIVVDFLVGLIPFIGDLADAAVKCNTRNVRLLERRLEKVYNSSSGSSRRPRGSPPLPPATVYEDFSDEEDGTTLPRHNNERKPSRPNPVRTKTERGRRQSSRTRDNGAGK